MKLLVTAGNTQVLIDQVRCLTNIFTGQTGASIALEAHRRGHDVTLMTSHPATVAEIKGNVVERWRLEHFQTFDDLSQLMSRYLRQDFDCVIHSAAVSDYLAAGAFAPATGTMFLAGSNTWHTNTGTTPSLLDRAAGKIKSAEPELWLRLARAPKLVDMIRSAWGFHGTLVKFKLEVGVSDEQLLDIAEKSRCHSQADLMVANTLEGAKSWAYIGPLAKGYMRVARQELAAKLIAAVESTRS